MNATEPTAPLTPLLCLAAALLYMVNADGQIDDHESSQIQATLGGNEDILALALDYVAVTPIEEFLSTAAPLLNQKETLCILTNVCDSLLSDGVVTDDEKALFQQFSVAFEFNEASFASYDRALRFKNNKLKLGTYSYDALTSPFPPAHLSLAACLLYMMAADGHISEEEIGQLQVVIGEFEGLQEVAMQEVRCKKLNQFLRGATPYLNEDQKLFILVNVYDSMLSDGVAEEKEHLLFENMQDAFAISGHKLAPFLKAIEAKNFKPKETQIDKDAIHTRKQRIQKQSDEWDAANQSSMTGEIVHRTLDHNIKQVSEGFNNQNDIDLVAANANNQDKRLKIKEGLGAANIQEVDEGGQIVNIQNIDTEAPNINRQSIETSADSDNRQSLEDEHLRDNLQALPDDLLRSQEAQFFAGARMDSLQQNITTVHHQLDLITPKSTWQKLDAFFKARPLSSQELFADRANELNSLESLESPDSPDSIASSDSNVSKGSIDTVDSKSDLQLDGFNGSEASSSHAEQEAEFNSAHIDGGIRLRSLLLMFGISIPLFGYAYGLIYPTMVCQGPTHQWQKWTPDGEASSSKVINDQVITERHLILIRRGEVNVTNQRFPLYKELNQSNHFAQQTDLGFKGSYSTHTVDQMNYVFEFLKDKNQLNIQSQSAGIRYIDGQSGHIEVFSVFKGQCDNRWF